MREIAHHCGSTALAFAMHTHQVAIPAWRWRHQNLAAVEPLLSVWRRKDHPPVKRRLGLDRRLRQGGEGRWRLRVSARKVFTSGASAGDILMTGAIVQSEGEPDMVIHFPVQMKAAEVKVLNTWRALGMRGTGSDDVLIDGLFVPETSVAARRKSGEWHPLYQIIATIAMPLIYSAYLGVAKARATLRSGSPSRNGSRITRRSLRAAWIRPCAPRNWRIAG